MMNWRCPRNPLAGGAERVTQAHLEALVKRGHDAVWFAHAYPGCESSETINGVQIVRGGNVFTRYFKVLSWYRKQPKFDLVIDQHHGVPWFAPWWCRTNCIAYIHEVLGPIWDSFFHWPLNEIGRAQERFNYRLYRNVPFWTVCESTRKELEDFGVRQVKVLTNGIDTEALETLDERSLTPPYRLVMCSRLAPNKRVDHGILALKELVDRSIDAKLTIIGSGFVESELKRLVTKLQLTDKVVFTGQVSEEEKLRLFRESHVLLHTSVREGWGLNVVEANAMGTPAVVYPVPGLVDSTQHLKTGIVTKSETPEAVADAFQLLIKDETLYQALRANTLQSGRSIHWNRVLPVACDWLEEKAAS